MRKWEERQKSYDGRGEDREKKSYSSFRRRSERKEEGFSQHEERREIQSRPSRGGELGIIMDIDSDILHLIARRSQLLSKISSSGQLSSEKEKTLRIAWENKAAKLSRDKRLSHDFFVLLQSIETLTRAEEEQGFFNLAPSSTAVDINLPAPTDTIAARCWLALSVASGQIVHLKRVPLNNAVTNGIKVLNQIGGQIWWEEDGEIQNRGGKGIIRNMDKVIHIGNDVFNLWLVLAFCVGIPSRLKLMGEQSLRFLNLAPVRHFLPRIGVRLTNVIPSQDGLPIRIECSGITPSEVLLPDDVPEDFSAALVLASLFWEKSCRFVFPDASKQPRLLPLILGMLSVCGVLVISEGNTVTVDKGKFTLPEEPVVPMDVVVAAFLLMLPGFNGGRAELAGVWGYSRVYTLVEEILAKAGLEISYGKEKVVCSGKNHGTIAPSLENVESLLKTCPDLLPLAALITAAAVCEGTKVEMPALSGEDRHIFTSFLAVCGVEEKDGVLFCSKEDTSKLWVAPSAPWAMAYAMAAFLRPNIHLSNPGILNEYFPSFWKIYNTLPCPSLSRREEQESVDVKPSRRRVIAQGVYGELPPDTPAGDDF